jgi:hypothetical protein
MFKRRRRVEMLLAPLCEWFSADMVGSSSCVHRATTALSTARASRGDNPATPSRGPLEREFVLQIRRTSGFQSLISATCPVV